MLQVEHTNPTTKPRMGSPSPLPISDTDWIYLLRWAPERLPPGLPSLKLGVTLRWKVINEKLPPKLGPYRAEGVSGDNAM